LAYDVTKTKYYNLIGWWQHTHVIGNFLITDETLSGKNGL